MAKVVPPKDRDGFEIAIICALQSEADAVEALFDKYWDEDGDRYGKAPGDTNTYTTGTVGCHNVVLAHMPGMGKGSAASVASSFRSSFERIKLALVVGICGGVPSLVNGEEILLGDVIISTGIIQYDFGRQLPDRFVRKDTLEDNLGRPNTEIRAFLSKLGGLRSRKRLGQNTFSFLQELCKEADFEKAQYPGPIEDRLYQRSYRHKHHDLPSCTICTKCEKKEDNVCETALGSSCSDLKCQDDKLVQRQRLHRSSGAAEAADAQRPRIHFGLIASGDMVMKSGEDRDEIALREKVIGFEMEGAGVWDNFPCVVIKGVCDYADSHKNKKWQGYAAAAAAACMKAFLKEWVPAMNPSASAIFQEFCNQDLWMQRIVRLAFRFMFKPPEFVLILLTLPKAQWGISFEQYKLFVARESQLDEATPKLAPEKKRVLHIPFPHNTAFVGREKIIRQIQTKISEPDSDHQLALYGLGGIGKSQIVLQYAHMTTETAPECSIFWVVAGNRHRFERDYRDIAKKLGLKGADDPKVDVFQLVKDALEEHDFQNWLMIVDNADDMDLFFDQSQPGQGLRNFIPKNSKGSIIYTTRSKADAQRLTDEGSTMPVEVMGTEDSLSLLEKKFGEGVTDKKVVIDMLNELEYLPLAIVQAASYMRQKSWTIQQYLQYYKEKDSDMALRFLLHEFKDKARIDGVTNAVLKTWIITFEQVEQQDSRAGELLWMMSFFDRQNIPAYLLKGVGESQGAIADAIGTLKAFSFVVGTLKSNNIDENFTIHRLVQVSTRYWLRLSKHKDRAEQCATNALVSLAREFPTGDEHENRDRCAELYSHTEPVISFQPLPIQNPSAFAKLLGNLSRYLRSQGQYNLSEGYARRAVEVSSSRLGNSNVQTLTNTHALAEVLLYQSKYTEAEQMHRQTLNLRENVLGPEHPDTLSSIRGLAAVLSYQGKHLEAEQMQYKTLELYKKVLGHEYPQTLGSMNDLAAVLWYQGKYVEAEERQRQTLELRKKVLGHEHPNTLNSMNDLAATLSSQDKNIEAEQMHRQTLELNKKVLGHEHPNTLKSISWVATALSSQGKYVEAEQIHRQALELSKKVLDHEHPQTLKSMNDLAAMLWYQGKYVEAEQMHRQTLELSKKVLGHEHLDTLNSMSWVASTLSSQGKYVEAEQMHRQTLELCKKVLGLEHINTLISTNNVGVMLENQQKYAEAEVMYRRVMEGREKTLGPEHADTLASTNSVGVMLHNQQKNAEAEVMYRRAMEGREKTLGPENADTLTSINNVGVALDNQQKYAEAEVMYRRAMEGREKTLGPEHPDTLTSIKDLEVVLGQLKFEEAVKKHEEALKKHRRGST
ncbi:uncharacterized protein PAC_18491 [Phialocephala subalpina]|uniref:Uncharacterized protein n=1 Tax=Phialocephala subalpina TaxID=576137 RepID=A0A1L7XU89_9HELO|nr:uncharacterized protein PAC_18491 [Phialocephala subalpina]